jgi:hypothetical protein
MEVRRGAFRGVDFVGVIVWVLFIFLGGREPHRMRVGAPDSEYEREIMGVEMTVIAHQVSGGVWASSSALV